MKLSRTFRHYLIEWDRGSTWSFYATAAEAQAQIDRSEHNGHVLASDFTVVFDTDKEFDRHSLVTNDTYVATGKIELVDQKVVV